MARSGSGSGWLALIALIGIAGYIGWVEWKRVRRAETVRVVTFRAFSPEGCSYSVQAGEAAITGFVQATGNWNKTERIVGPRDLSMVFQPPLTCTDDPQRDLRCEIAIDDGRVLRATGQRGWHGSRALGGPDGFYTCTLHVASNELVPEH